MIEFWMCAILAIIFGMLGIFFALAKENGAKFVSGFNSFSKDEQALYDKKLISKDMRNQCFICSLIMTIGAILAYFVEFILAIIALIVWFVFFIKEVHLDNHKAFAKYLIK